MKTYAIFFEGYYPVGAVAIVTASDIKKAEQLLKTKLKKMKLSTKNLTVKEIITDNENVEILLDGDY